jgi:hypothetical protein
MAGNAELLDYYSETHARRVYGTSSVKYVRFLKPWIDVRRPRSVIDYGCGQSILLEALDLGGEVVCRRYDPAIPEFEAAPAEPSDLLLCIDVLEHIEEADVDVALAEMRAWCKEAIIVVDTVPAKHTLPDGRNAHITLRSHAWWQDRVRQAFGIAEPIVVPRRSRAAFRTWQSDAAELRRYRRLRLACDLNHHLRRLFRRHKRAWKVSSTGAKGDA